MDDDAREARIARNESRFREINEQLEADLRRLPGDPEMVWFVCECGNRACAELVQMTFEEYARVRSDSHTFAVVPGHELPDAEEVVQRNERFHVVAKVERTERIVETTDPRQ
jgi:hypothetical protein